MLGIKTHSLKGANLLLPVPSNIGLWFRHPAYNDRGDEECVGRRLSALLCAWQGYIELTVV